MKRQLQIMMCLVAGLGLWSATTATQASAATCKGETCETFCGSGTCTINHAACDTNPTDGVCVVCPTNASQAMDVVGSALADRICGSDVADTIDAGDGDDAVFGGPGADTIEGGFGEDTLDGQGGDDNISDAGGGRVLVGGSGDDTLETVADAGADPNDPAEHSPRGAILCGGKGKDVLIGGGYGPQCLDPEGGQMCPGPSDCTCGSLGVDSHDVCQHTDKCCGTSGTFKPGPSNNKCGC